MSTIVNCTPHDITLYSVEDAVYDVRTRGYSLVGNAIPVRTISSSGIIPRCTTSEVDMPELDGVPTITLAFGEVENLPEQKEDTYYIVSALVKNASSERPDLLTVGRTVRNSAGQIVGCLVLAR